MNAPATTTVSMPAKFTQVQKDLLKHKSRISKALMKHSRFDADQLLGVVGRELRRNQRLLNCSVESLANAVCYAASLMLEPDKELGYFYLIPFKDQVTVIVGYKGYIELVLRSDKVKSIYAQEVYEADTFDIMLGTDKRVHHRPGLRSRGDLLGVYCIATLVDGSTEIEFMTKEEVDLIRARSKSPNEGPWVTDYASMARKTIIRRMAKYLPKAFDAHRAVAADEASERGEPLDFVDSEFEVVDTTTGEVIKTSEPPTNTGAAPIAASLTDKLKDK